jgi:hypothetical protein
MVHWIGRDPAECGEICETAAAFANAFHRRARLGAICLGRDTNAMGVTEQISGPRHQRGQPAVSDGGRRHASVRGRASIPAP